MEVTSLQEHTDALLALIVGLVTFIGICFGIITKLFSRTVDKFDKNQNKLFTMVEALTKEFYMLLGEHHRNHDTQCSKP